MGSALIPIERTWLIPGQEGINNYFNELVSRTKKIVC